ncbi:RNA polymerase sigma factor, sigma-70 family [Microlunatus flavus]|uniref:RNA polymerase sigma factor, sigma-70 family n=2 Tax=Microlunatus flavus TaxID=1036181 RepID=A0A1H9MIT1_9ACTN|nr:RNA polymerase sigma factor, sigma-70 family [Microlunatus flavus]
MDEGLLRALVPQVITALLRRGADFASAEDAVQEALVDALRTWPTGPPRDPRAWLTRAAVHRLTDAVRSEAARRRREERVDEEPEPGPTEQADDTLLLLFLCASPQLSPTSAVALTLRAVAGLTTREIADAFLVPEATMAQRISRAKATLRDRSLDAPADVAVVLHVLHLAYTTGHQGDERHDLAREAIRLTRQLVLASPEPEVRGLLALMLLHHARHRARVVGGRLVPLDEQDRALWDHDEIAEGVRILQGALGEQRRGRFQVEAAIAALHDDATTAAETDWSQILSWYDELLAQSPDPVRDDPAAVLSRAVAVGHVLGASAGLLEVERVAPELKGRYRVDATRAYLLRLAGDLPEAAEAYARAAERCTSTLERDHLVRQAALARAAARVNDV